MSALRHGRFYEDYRRWAHVDITAEKVKAAIARRLKDLDGDEAEQRDAFAAVGSTLALVESLIMHEIGSDSPFLKEVERIRTWRAAGIAGQALRVREAREKYREMAALTDTIGTLGVS